MKLNPVFCIVLSSLIALGLASCSTGNELTKKRYKRLKHPKEKPFVYYNQINIQDNTLKKEKRILLEGSLTTQLVDSMRVRVKETALIDKKLIDPPLYDSVNAVASERNMEIYLKTIGFYYGRVTHQTIFDTIKGRKGSTEIHAITQFNVNTGPLVKIGSVQYTLWDTSMHKASPYALSLISKLQQLADENRSKSFLKKDDPFTESLMLTELERLVELYRNNGYYKFSREQVYIDADSFYVPLLNPFLDPFERIKVFEEAKKWRANPTFDIVIRLRPRLDSTALIPYKTGSVTVYPEYTNAAFDSTQYKTVEYGDLTIKHKTERFKPSFIASHIYLRRNTIYKLNSLNNTLDELNNLGTWQFIKVEPIDQKLLSPQPDTGIVNFDFRMVPNKRYSISADLETVFNQVQQAAIGVAGNLVGAGINLGFKDRNLFKRGVQWSQTFRFGVEVGTGRVNPGVQAIELTYSTSLSVPKLILLPNKMQNKLVNKRSFVTGTASYFDRNLNENGLYKLNNINIAAGWQFSRLKARKTMTFTVLPLNVEFVKLYKLSQPFRDTLNKNPFLQFSFREGLVIGLSGNVVYTKDISERKSLYLRVGAEESGLTIWRFLRSIPDIRTQLFNYIKADAEIKYTRISSSKKTTWVFRAVAGAGYNFADTASMPFFKQFTGGGPNSMRAWPLRSIGPGARPLDSRSGRGQFFSRSGDFIFEANAEYRYNIFTVIPNTFVVRGALFTDVGNVWNFRNRSNLGNDTVVLQLKNFYRQLGVSAGSGLRLDFVGLFVIRLDFGLRIKNPSLPFSKENNGWRIPEVNWRNLFSSREANRQWRYENFNFSLGINYPF